MIFGGGDDNYDWMNFRTLRDAWKLGEMLGYLFLLPFYVLFWILQRLSNRS